MATTDEASLTPAVSASAGSASPPAPAYAEEPAQPLAQPPAQQAAQPKRRRAPAQPVHRVQEQPAFVLHSYPYRETSLIVDVLTRDHGRLALVAKGAKRPHSALRGVLQTFQPLMLAWSGRSEMRTLTRAEWVGGMLPLAGDALVCGFYANELLVRFCAREDPHPSLFHQYAVTLTRLAHDEPAALVLRSFERHLLRETGYAVAFSVNVNSAPPQPDAWYVFDPDRGARLASDYDPVAWPRILGRTLIDMEADDYNEPRTVSQSKALMRFLLNHHLGGTPLNTRQILIDLQKL